MPSKRRKIDHPGGHPRGKYTDHPPDFRNLASLYPSFLPFVSYTVKGNPKIDWTDFNATRELTRVLLYHDHGVNWWIPDGQLCPTVPNRSNYIHWIEDLLSSDIIRKPEKEGRIRGFDIGTGANCIYPLLGASLLEWSFVGSDYTDVAIEWAKWNVENNPQIAELIEIRNSLGSEAGEGATTDTLLEGETHISLSLVSEVFPDKNDVAHVAMENSLVDQNPSEVEESVCPGVVASLASSYSSEQGLPDSDGRYYGPPVLVDVVRDDEKFDFCMCNPPFFESMDEAGLNPKTSCGGTAAEMVCPGGELAFITRIIEDSVELKNSFWWFTSMVGRKVNLKILATKLWKVGVTVVQTTEFIQGHTSRWGLAWSFFPPNKKKPTIKFLERTHQSFMLEGLQRHCSAVQVLESVELFYREAGASCKTNSSSFSVDVTISREHSEVLIGRCSQTSVFADQTDADEFNSPNGLCHLNDLSFRILVFQQIPGTLLIKASLTKKDSSLADLNHLLSTWSTIVLHVVNYLSRSHLISLVSVNKLPRICTLKQCGPHSIFASIQSEPYLASLTVEIDCILSSTRFPSPLSIPFSLLPKVHKRSKLSSWPHQLLILILAETVTAVSAAVSLPTSKASSLLPTRTSSSSERICFHKGFLGGRVIVGEVLVTSKRVSAVHKFAVRAQTVADVPAKVEKVHKKNEEGVIVNKYKPKEPYIGRCLLNTRLTGDDAPGETWHMVFSTEGEVPYREGQSIGVIPDGIDKNGKPHKLRLYSIASSANGDFGDSKTVSLCVKRLVYTNDQGEIVKGVCSNFLCDLKPGSEVKITGPVGKEMLMPVDPNATIVMLATGTGIAPFRGFLWKMFFEKHEDYKFNGLAWLFLGVPTSSTLLYKEEFEKMKEIAPDNFRLDFAVSREQTNEKGEKMYIQTRMAQYAEELWELLKKDNTFVYMCGLKGMEKGIDDIMTSLAARDGINWLEYKRQLKKAEQWNVEVY